MAGTTEWLPAVRELGGFAQLRRGTARIRSRNETNVKQAGGVSGRGGDVVR